jgi:hypothetical protein
MKENIKYGVLFLMLVTISFSCIKSYAPPAITGSNNYLVVDGTINMNPNEPTIFALSRSRNLNDTVSFIPELNAQASIVGSDGSTYPMVDSNNNGHYTTDSLNLSMSNRYRIVITTSDGNQYASNFATPKTTPAIDSVTWEDNTNVNIFVNTHDPQNNTRYYRWDFTETWQYTAPFYTTWILYNGLITPLESNLDPRQIYNCWNSALSSNLLVGTSLGLSQDVISHQQINTILQNDIRLTVRYSILVNQYALTDSAYLYWSLAAKNSQQLGTLFDVQPSQLAGNISCTTKPSAPVIGYVTASTITHQRIYITNDQVGWIKVEPYQDCRQMTIPTSDYQIWNYPDPSYLPYYFTGTSPYLGLIIIKKWCIDCRTQGGINVEPSFW